MTFSLHSTDLPDHFYNEEVKMTDLVYIGDSLTQLKAHDEPIMIFKVPQLNGRAHEFFIPLQDYMTLNSLNLLTYMQSPDFLKGKPSASK